MLQLLHKNMTIVSNFCEFDETGLIVGLKTPMIHMYNKVLVPYPIYCK